MTFANTPLICVRLARAWKPSHSEEEFSLLKNKLKEFQDPKSQPDIKTEKGEHRQEAIFHDYLIYFWL